MSVIWETATLVKNGVTYWLKDEKARALIKECYSPSNPPPAGGAVSSVNGKTGDVELDAADVGALPDTTPIPTKTSDLTNDSGFITAAAVPTKTSDLTNDSGFITAAAVPTKTSELTNDSGFITAAAVPTKTSDLTNDSGFITAADVPTKTSDLTNDSGFVNAAEAANAAPVQSVNGQTGDVVIESALTPSAAFAIPASGSSVSYDMDGLTADHELVRWNFSASAENAPPAKLTWTTFDGYFTVSNTGGTTAESIRPVFALPVAKAITNH